MALPHPALGMSLAHLFPGVLGPLESVFFSLPHSMGWVPVSAPHRLEGSKPSFHSCYGKYKIQLHPWNTHSTAASGQLFLPLPSKS